MVRIEDFHVEFEHKWAVYHPGDLVTGVVHLRVNDKIYVDTALANFYGLARVMWVNREVKGNSFRSVTYSSENVYFNEKVDLWRYSGSGGGEKEATPKVHDELDAEIEAMLQPRRNHLINANSGPHLPPGVHEFKFSFRLPPNLPTSFDAKHSDGYIRYWIKICLMSQDAIKHSRKAYFTVVKPQDLNLMSPLLREPMSKETRRQCRDGLGLFGNSNSSSNANPSAIRMGVRMTKGGYVPGEPIFVRVDIENKSKKSLKAFKLHLMQRVVCLVDKPDLESKTTISSIVTIGRTDKIRAGETSVWDAGPLYIPAVVPSFDLDNSMQVSYFVKIEAYRDQGVPKVHMDLPIVIGTVPLKSSEEKFMGGGLENNLPSAPPAYGDIIGIPPPTYEESVAGMSGGNEKEDEACIPRYVVYNFQ